MRLIDADKMLEKVIRLKNASERVCDQFNMAAIDFECAIYAEKLINYQTTVDAVPVVRCKDCLYFQQLGRCGVRVESYTDPDGFCHLGKKKEEN